MYYNRIAFQYAATIDSTGLWSPNELLGTLVSVAPPGASVCRWMLGLLELSC